MVDGAATQGSHFTEDRDPRITRIGGFIRKTSLDELPQLINVLSGEMSLVGPRPNVPKQRVEYTGEEWSKRNAVRPGITGLAQATLRSAATPKERTSLDLEYVDKSGFVYDLWILVLTVRQVLFRGSH
jgi:lipopolysaccharide/colanic/teichoic acid biosynthesis glycosyltransferase